MKDFIITQNSCKFATKLQNIKRLRHIFAIITWTIIGIYVMSVVLLHIPAVQHYVASQTAEAIAEKLGTRVQIGNVNLGILNRIIIDDVTIDDQQQQKMFTCHRLSAKLDILPILRGKISISSAQIFGMKAMLIKPDETSPLNCQFVLDSLASKDTTHHTPLDLRISSVVIRNSAVSYDRNDRPHRNGVFDANHISLNKISSHAMLYALTDDSLSMNMRNLSLIEENSGLSINNLSFEAERSKGSFSISNFNLRTDDSDVCLNASASLDGKKLKSYRLVSSHSAISTKDISLFVPALKNINKTVFLDAKISGTSNSVDVKQLGINTAGKDLILTANGKAQSSDYILDAISQPKSLTWNANITKLHADGELVTDVLNALNINTSVISRLGDIDYSATASGSNGNVLAKGSLQTATGKVNHDITLRDKHLTANVKTSNFQLGTLLNTDVVGSLTANINASTDIVEGKQKVENTRIKLNIPQTEVKGYQYNNINLNIAQRGNNATATIDLADLNAGAKIALAANNISALLQGNSKALNNIALSADISHINPNALGLVKNYQSTTFSCKVNAKVKDLSTPLDNASVSVTDFAMTSPTDKCSLNNLDVNTLCASNGERLVSLTSDFATVSARGKYSFETLKQSVMNLVSQKLPTLPGMKQFVPQHNTISLDANISDTEVLRQLAGLKLTLNQPVNIRGYLNDITEKADITIDAPSITYSGTTFDNTHLHVSSPGDTLNIVAESSKLDKKGHHLAINILGKAANNNLITSIGWNNGKGDDFHGSLNARSQFFVNKDGNATADVNIIPSEIVMGDSIWTVHPAEIIYTKNKLNVRDFLVDHEGQLVQINGTATNDDTDSLTVNLFDVNVAYILNFVNFHSVAFSGLASGTAVVKSLFATPDAHADIDVHDFRFETGRMGTMTAHARWNNELGQIDVNAKCHDDNVTETLDGLTDINGYISIKQNYLDLDIKAENTRCEFMQSFCSSFLADVNAWASGHIRLWGPMSKINLTGDAVANGSALVTSLNTVYTLHNDSVHFVIDDILLPHVVLYDKNGNTGVMTGALHHKHLSRMTFDLNIAAKHLLCYDFPDLNGDIFCGHVVGSGNCKMTGRPGEVTFDIDAYPEETSYLTYNASSPEGLQSQEFVTWHDVTPTWKNDTLDLATIITPKAADAFHTNIHLNFLVHAQPTSTLRIIMDERTGDYITLNGSGTLRATYYNKGGMQIFGNYAVEQGVYKMTIQQVITKNFDFLSGGTIAFGGEPFDATLDLKAQYVVPSVPLSDLQIGNSFSNNTVRVNCLMNISGTAGQPIVTFDLNMPQASTDIQQMITSLIDSEQERNQQVLYLLSIGRFYDANNNASAETGQSQTALAMQSFLSGTLSQQLNNVISDMVLKNHNWNFGANISPGDEGMMNADYEGLISGRMLNNRLLLNGQFGYRDNANASTSFIGDFDVRYLLFPNGNLQVKVYNQTSDRYFTKSSLNTQGVGFIFKHDFNSFLFNRKNKKK